jgi:hypothetical protein
MANRKLRKLANFRMLVGVLLIAALAPVICAQAPRQLEVEVGANQQISILARDVSYGEVLRALERKLGWEMEISPLADELKLSYVRVETTQPQVALAKLLEGSGLGYAFLSGVNGTRKMKVIVIPLTPREATVVWDTTPNSPIPDNTVAGGSLPLPAQAQPATTLQPNATALDAMMKQPKAPSTTPLAEAVNAMGVPPGVSPADVGKTTTMPLPIGPGKHP